MSDEPPFLCDGVHTFIVSREAMELDDLIELTNIAEGAAYEVLTPPIYSGFTDSFTYHMRIKNP